MQSKLNMVARGGLLGSALITQKYTMALIPRTIRESYLYEISSNVSLLRAISAKTNRLTCGAEVAARRQAEGRFYDSRDNCLMHTRMHRYTAYTGVTGSPANHPKSLSRTTSLDPQNRTRDNNDRE
jgi:hypothetical protein